jgi:hypothetical protein
MGGEIAHERAMDARGTPILALDEASRSYGAMHAVSTADIAQAFLHLASVGLSGKSAGSV